MSVTEQSERSLIGWAEVIYGLHAFSLLTGILGAATVVGAFLTGWPSIIAVILNYVKRSEVARHLARVAFPLADPHVLVRPAVGGALRGCSSSLTLGIGILIAWLPLAIVGIWFVYRIVRGWLALRDRQPCKSRRQHDEESTRTSCRSEIGSMLPTRPGGVCPPHRPSQMGWLV